MVVKPLMHRMHQYIANRNVLRDCLKLFLLITVSRKLPGREFKDRRTGHTESSSALRAKPVVWYI